MIKGLMQKIPRYEKKISEYILRRIDSWYRSDKYDILKKRHDSINRSMDMKFGGTASGGGNSFKTNFVLPLAREAFIAQRAITWSAFLAEPLFTLSPLGTSSYSSAKKCSLY